MDDAMEALGSLVDAGFSVDALLDMPFEHWAVMAEARAVFRRESLMALIDPVLAGFGDKEAERRVQERKAKAPRTPRDDARKARDLEDFLASAGLPIVDG